MKGRKDPNLQKAVEDVKKGKENPSSAATKYGVSRSTLKRYLVRRIDTKRNGNNHFNMVEEESLIDHLELLANHSVPFGVDDLRNIAQLYMTNRDKSGVQSIKTRPSRSWAYAFVKRNKDRLSLRIARNIKRVRAQISEEEVRTYIDNLKESLEGIVPQNILNYDETNFR